MGYSYSSSSFGGQNRFEYYFIQRTKEEGEGNLPSLSFATSYPDLKYVTAPKKKHLNNKSDGGCKTMADGETTLTDFRKVYNDLHPNLRAKLVDKKLLYRRTIPPWLVERVARSVLVAARSSENAEVRNDDDVMRAKSWFQLFGTTNKKQAERMCLRI